MNEKKYLVVFSLDEQKFAMDLNYVEKIAQVTEIMPLPKAPDIVMGVINVQGRIVPVVNIRKRFQLPEHEIELDDHFIIGKTEILNIAILVDSVLDIIEHSDDDIIEQKNILPNIDHIEGIVKSKGDMIIIHDLKRLLSIEESEIIKKAIQNEKDRMNEKISDERASKRKNKKNQKVKV